MSINSEIQSGVFNEEKTLGLLSHYLPSQTPLKDFIHHNSLHAFQHYQFFDALSMASQIFGYQTTLKLADFRKLKETGRISDEVIDKAISSHTGSENLNEWREKMLKKPYDEVVIPRVGAVRNVLMEVTKLNMDDEVHPLLFRILSSYVDQGISGWSFPLHPDGFLASVRQLQKLSIVGILKSKKAIQLLKDKHTTIASLLNILIGREDLYEQYLFDQQFAHRGWAGMASTLEHRPDGLLDRRKISLKDLILLELLLEIDVITRHKGADFKPLASLTSLTASPLFGKVPVREYDRVMHLWQEAFEWSYYDVVLAGIRKNRENGSPSVSAPTFQALFCIDERECSLRRHIEKTDPDCATYGTPGFFSVEFYYRPAGAQFNEKLCPAPVTPKYLVKEKERAIKRETDFLYHPKMHHPVVSSLASIGLGIYAGYKLAHNILKPTMSPAISNAFAHMDKRSTLLIEASDPPLMEEGLQVGFTCTEMANRVEALLRSIHLVDGFSPLVYVMAHGSSSANNPHHGAHDCGACSGRPGSVNARVYAFMANHPQVREILRQRNIDIPSTTRFIGALHDTAGDNIEFYDDEELASPLKEQHTQNIKKFEAALDLNARERSRRFASINTRQDLAKVRKAINDRSVSMFEPRPELGHGTNTLCIIGPRTLTKGLFLDRRAFLNSYSYVQDPAGTILTNVMRPIGPVCGGINLEYYFSRVDNYKLGAGTKLPHNVVGLIGVSNSSDGDLRPGLPLQMIEVHDPLRLLILVEHYPEVVLKAIQSSDDMYEWYKNRWVHLMVIHPETAELCYFSDGHFHSYENLTELVPQGDPDHLIAHSIEMETNYIVDATKENLPVFFIP